VKKLCGIGPGKSGTNLLRHIWGIVGQEGARSAWTEIAIARMEKQEDYQYILGHVFWSPEVEDVIRGQGREIILLTRDPRDIIVSRWYWQKDHKRLPQSYSWCIKKSAYQIRQIAPWESRPGVHKLRFEDMILHPQETSARLAGIMDVDQAEVEERMSYRGGPTYRPGGGIGTHKNEFPEELWPLYSPELECVKHWEYE
jgi:hypothetical protein